MKKIAFTITIGILVLLFGLTDASFAATTQVDALIEKLVEKGVLNRQESIKLKAEIADDEKIVREEGLKQSLPTWVREMKLKGDLRVRYQNEKRKGSNLNMGNTTERERGRIRFRLGAETKVNDQIKAHFGLASGGTDPRSTNQTLENTFELKDIRLDYAYAEYAPFKWATLLGGRMANPLWEPGDMLWDTDIHPEGVAGKFKWKLNSNLEPYLNTALFLLDENSATSDPAMYVFQPGLKWKINDGLDLNLATAYYGFKSVEGTTLSHNANNNTAVNNGGRDFNSISPTIELGVKELFGLSALPYFGLFGEYIHNFDAKQSKNGYMGGMRLGHKKVKDFGQWQLRYTRTLLETYAWPDVFPDSDRYGGRTGIRGHEVLLTYGLGKNWNLELDYYRTDLTSTPDKTENLFQADLNFKF